MNVGGFSLDYIMCGSCIVASCIYIHSQQMIVGVFREFWFSPPPISSDTDSLRRRITSITTVVRVGILHTIWSIKYCVLDTKYISIVTVCVCVFVLFLISVGWHVEWARVVWTTCEAGRCYTVACIGYFPTLSPSMVAVCPSLLHWHFVLLTRCWNQKTKLL